MLVSVKLTPSELELLDEVVEVMGFKSRSDAIREGLGVLFRTVDPKEETLQQIRLERLGSPPRTKRRPKE